jgi:hypothetical protein
MEVSGQLHAPAALIPGNQDKTVINAIGRNVQHNYGILRAEVADGVLGYGRFAATRIQTQFYPDKCRRPCP